MLQIERLTVRFGAVAAVRDLNLELPDRGVVALIGPNAAGKSTLLDVLAGFQRPSGGQVRKGNGRRLGPANLKALTARLHQVMVLPDDVSIVEYLELASDPERGRWMIGGGQPRPGNRQPRWPEALRSPSLWQLIATADLESQGGAIPRRLSWGQQRLVALAAVALAPKRVLLLDEPFAGLASPAAAAVSTLLKQEGERRLVLIAEHDLARLLPLADRVLVMVAGKLAADHEGGELAPEELLHHFAPSGSDRATASW